MSDALTVRKPARSLPGRTPAGLEAPALVKLFDWYEVVAGGESAGRWAVAARGRHQ